MSNRRYTVQDGDTFERISRREYGTASEAGRIRRSNPGVTEPLQPGSALAIPAKPDDPQDQPATAPAQDRDEVALRIDGKRFRYWESVNITRALDSPDSLAFTAPFEPEDAEFRESFRPFSFRDLELSIGGERIFTGVLVNPTPQAQDQRFTVDVSGYSLPGVLQDCTPPSSAWPVEFDGLNLRDIAAAVCEPFGIGVYFLGNPGAAFEREAMQPGGTIFSFLKPLAQQRGFVLGSTPDGLLRILEADSTTPPVARLREGESPLLSVTPQFSPQQYFSHITGMETVGVGFEGSQYTVDNPHLSGVVRPNTFQVTDAQGGEVKRATEAKMGRMFGDVVSYTAQVATWRTPDGELWAPNTTVTVLAPHSMIYSEYRFLIRKVEFDRDANQKTATLTLALPGSYSGEIPEAMPWDG